MASSLRDVPVAEDVVAFGEIGLAGEVRGVTRTPARIAEAAAMGFRRALAPVSAQPSEPSDTAPTARGLSVTGVRTLGEAIDAAL